MSRFDPSRPDFSPYGFSCVRWTPTAMERCDRHNEIELNLLERGSLTYLLGGRKVVVPAGRLAVFWAGVPHQVLEFEGLNDYFVLTIPLAWFLQWRLPDQFTQAILVAVHGVLPSSRPARTPQQQSDECELKQRNLRCQAALPKNVPDFDAVASRVDLV